MMTTANQRGRMDKVARYFIRLGLLGFCGPVALVSQMEREQPILASLKIFADASWWVGAAAVR
jgi:hypothetical protein